MERITIGIDPGQTGAISIMEADKITALYDMPTSARLHGKGQQVDGYTLATLLLEHTGGANVQVLIEAVSAMPGNGASSMFRFGESVGVVLGVCGALQLPVQWIRLSMEEGCRSHWQGPRTQPERWPCNSTPRW